MILILIIMIKNISYNVFTPAGPELAWLITFIIIMVVGVSLPVTIIIIIYLSSTHGPFKIYEVV